MVTSDFKTISKFCLLTIENRPKQVQAKLKRNILLLFWSIPLSQECKLDMYMWHKKSNIIRNHFVEKNNNFVLFFSDFLFFSCDFFNFSVNLNLKTNLDLSLGNSILILKQQALYESTKKNR